MSHLDFKECKECPQQYLNSEQACAGCYENLLDRQQNYEAPRNRDKAASDKILAKWATKKKAAIIIERIVSGMVQSYNALPDCDNPGRQLMDRFDGVDLAAQKDSYKNINYQYGGSGKSIENKCRAILMAIAETLYRQRRLSVRAVCELSPVPIDLSEIKMLEAVKQVKARRAGILQRIQLSFKDLFREKTLSEYATEIKAHCPELNLVISGTWLWAEGSTEDYKTHRKYLISRGMVFVSRKSMWARPSREDVSRSKNLTSQEAIYRKYGKRIVN